jgi:ribosome-associated translation inhibitor RaiA
MAQLQLTFRGMNPSDSVRVLAEREFHKLERHVGRASSCHIVLDRPAASHLKGAQFSVRVQLHGGSGVHVAAEARHHDARAAMREAFERVGAQVSSQSEARSSTRRSAASHIVLLR